MCLAKLFDYLKAYHQILPELEIQQALILLTSNSPLYDLPGLDVKIPEKSLTRRILDKKMGQINDELEQILTYSLQNDYTEFLRKEGEI